MKSLKKHRLRAAVTAALAGSLLVSTGGAPASATNLSKIPTFTLSVLFTNDMESALLGVEGDGTDEGPIVDGGDRPYGSPSRAKTLMNKLRKEATTGWPKPGQALWRGEVTVSGGDNFLAGPEFSASLENGVPFYDALAIKEIGYDASAVGNHEFDFGPEVFGEFIESLGGSLDYVSANLDVSGEPSLDAYAKDGTLVTSKVLRSSGQRIGMIGLTTPELPALSSPRNVTVDGNLAGIANGLADDFKKRGINKVIVVSHLQDIDNELALVPQLSGIDAVVGAGGGEILANDKDRLIPGDEAERGFPLYADDATGKSIPVVTTTGDYKYIGRLVLNFNFRGEVVSVDKRQTGPVRVSGVGPDAVHGDHSVRAQVEKPVAEHLATLSETVVATSEVALNGVRNDVRTKETNLGNLVADSLLHAGKEQADEYGVAPPQVAIQNGGGLRNDSVLPAGDISALNTYDVAPFSNFVAVVPDVPRDVLRQLLERGVAASPAASGAFMQLGGVSVSYDPSKQAQVVDEGTSTVVTPGERIQDVTLADGTEIVKDGAVVEGAPISVVTNDFSARGGDGYPFEELPFTPVGMTYQQALEQYLTDGLSGSVSSEQYPEGGSGRIVVR
ncbi:bifunctional metallophosphatase/5'-nucleotidase [Prauserella marina]|uniref:5'-nucleotidase n=1 Tax=Prauserella marina TaxID=530584 RepID=A0A222VVQ3_9PSEU|nr:5'-nucleotidase C-terminal domain-containing protein [Prauserella marina]ASR38008.1 bifunctional metallophosphatase/5'-nucleotidase [Prauserella marina]PWV73240.1 5'-nucleotidase [Prauserella marina]SDD68467.1 5'-nucleotidase [Prauserella marina]